ncbi:hypothetical protein B0O99DRAFT_588959 [Bisporella sp. PMI_857]|nr:hypothetical protein B0O99DRAFT_588959 [Bisporella sp. PMI_857]
MAVGPVSLPEVVEFPTGYGTELVISLLYESEVMLPETVELEDEVAGPLYGLVGDTVPEPVGPAVEVEFGNGYRPEVVKFNAAVDSPPYGALDDVNPPVLEMVAAVLWPGRGTEVEVKSLEAVDEGTLKSVERDAEDEDELWGSTVAVELLSGYGIDELVLQDDVETKPLTDDEVSPPLLRVVGPPELVRLPFELGDAGLGEDVEFGYKIEEFDNDTMILKEAPDPPGTLVVSVITAVEVRYVVDSISLELETDEGSIAEELPVFAVDVLLKIELCVVTELCPDEEAVVESGWAVVVASLTKHEHAEDMRMGDPEHCETYTGSPVVIVLAVVV